MRRRIKMFIVCLATFLVGVGITSLFGSVHPSDSSLIENFKHHEAEFNLLARMASKDSRADIISSSDVAIKEGSEPFHDIYLEEGEPWPRSEAELGFTKQRWDEYRELFKKLNLSHTLSRKPNLPDAIFIAASVDSSDLDDCQTADTEKGYVYCPTEIRDPLSVSLDDVEANRPVIFFKKITDHWYLYYEWSLGKPE